jgi:hypothetical protein
MLFVISPGRIVALIKARMRGQQPSLLMNPHDDLVCRRRALGGNTLVHFLKPLRRLRPPTPVVVLNSADAKAVHNQRAHGIR